MVKINPDNPHPFQQLPLEVILLIFEKATRKAILNSRLTCKFLSQVLNLKDSYVKKIFMEACWHDHKMLQIKAYAARVRLVMAAKEADFRIFSNQIMWKRSKFDQLYQAVYDLERMQTTDDNLFPPEMALPITCFSRADLQLSDCQRVFPSPFTQYRPIFITSWEDTRTLLLIPETIENKLDVYAEVNLVCNLMVYHWNESWGGNHKRMERTSVVNTKIVLRGIRMAILSLFSRYHLETLENFSYGESMDWVYSDSIMVQNLLNPRLLRKLTPQDTKEMDNSNHLSFPMDLPTKLKTLPPPVPLLSQLTLRTIKDSNNNDDESDVIIIDE